MKTWWWLSFADDEQFLGAAVVAVDEKSIEFFRQMDPSDRIDLLEERGQEEDVPFYTAVQTASFLGINPGGEVKGVEIPPDKLDRIPEHLCFALLSMADIEQAGLL